MSYHWSSYRYQPWYINYHIYALIDKTGQGNISIHRKGKNEYYKIKLDEKFIKQVISSYNSYVTDSKLSYDKIVEGKMDEPDLKLRINRGEMNNSIISYMETDRFVHIKDFVKLFRNIDSLYMAGSYTKLDDTLDISRRRDDFIVEAMRIGECKEFCVNI
jgi:hypothetical protein